MPNLCAQSKLLHLAAQGRATSLSDVIILIGKGRIGCILQLLLILLLLLLVNVHLWGSQSQLLHKVQLLVTASKQAISCALSACGESAQNCLNTLEHYHCSCWQDWVCLRWARSLPDKLLGQEEEGLLVIVVALS